MKKQETLLALIEELKQEIKMKDEIIHHMQEKINGFEMYGSEWIDALNFKEAIDDARKAEQEYKKCYQDLLALKEAYRKALDDVVRRL